MISVEPKEPDQSVRDNIETIIQLFLDTQEQSGDQTGGSGHLASTSCILTTMQFQQLDSPSFSYKVIVEFTRSIESEFTYLPDNPPLEDYYSQEFYLDSNLQIAGFSVKVHRGSNMNISNLDFFDTNTEE